MGRVAQGRKGNHSYYVFLAFWREGATVWTLDVCPLWLCSPESGAFPKACHVARTLFQPTMNLTAWDICKTTVINHVTPLQNILQGPWCAFCISMTLWAHLCVCPSYILIHAQASFLATGQMYHVHDHVHALVHKMTFPWMPAPLPTT